MSHRMAFENLSVTETYDDWHKFHKEFKRRNVQRWPDLSAETLLQEATALLNSLARISENQATIPGTTDQGNVRIIAGSMLLIRFSPSHRQEALRLCSTVLSSLTILTPWSKFVLKWAVRAFRKRKGAWPDFSVHPILQLFSEGTVKVDLKLYLLKTLFSDCPDFVSVHLGCLFEWFIGHLANSANFETESVLFTNFREIAGDTLVDCQALMSSHLDCANRLPIVSELVEFRNCQIGGRALFGISAPNFEEFVESHDLRIMSLHLRQNDNICVLHEQIVGFIINTLFPPPASAASTVNVSPIFSFIAAFRSRFPDCDHQVVETFARALLNLRNSESFTLSQLDAICELSKLADLENEFCSFLVTRVKRSRFETLSILSKSPLLLRAGASVELINAIANCLDDAKSRIRVLVPKALAAFGPSFYHPHFDHLMSRLLSDESPRVLSSILSCLTPPFPSGWRKDALLFLSLTRHRDCRVRLAALKFIGSAGEPTLLRGYNAIPSIHISPQMRYEHSVLLFSLFSEGGQFSDLNLQEFFKQAVEFLKEERSKTPRTYSSERFARKTRAKYIQTLDIIVAAGKLDDTQRTELFEVLVSLLSGLPSNSETFCILSCLHTLSEPLGVKFCRGHPSLYSLLLATGGRCTDPKIHTLLFRIFGFVGVKNLEEPAESPWFDRTFHFDSLDLRPAARDQFAILRCCAAALSTLLRDESSISYHQQAFAALVNVIIRLDAEVSAPLRLEFKSFFVQWDKNSNRWIDILHSCCKLRRTLITTILEPLVNSIITHNAITAIPLLAASARDSLGTSVSSLVSFLHSAGPSEDSVKALSAIAKHCPNFASDIIGYLIDYCVVFEPAMTEIHDIIFASTPNLDAIALTLAQFCIAHFSIRDAPKTLGLICETYENVKTRIEAILPMQHLKDPDAVTPSEVAQRQPTLLFVSQAPPPRSLNTFSGDISKWFTALQQFAFSYSSSSELSLCSEVFPLSPSLSRELFPLAFFCCFRYGRFGPDGDAVFRDIVSSLAFAPPSILTELVALIEFCERAGLPIVDLKATKLPPSLGNVPLSLWNSLLLNKDVGQSFARLGLLEESRMLHCNGYLSEWTIAFWNPAASSVDSVIADFLQSHELKSIDNGFEILGKISGPSFAHGLPSVIQSIASASQLTELSNICNTGWIDRIGDVFPAAARVLLLRIDAGGNDGEKEALLRLTRKSGELDLFLQYFKKIYPPPAHASREAQIEYAYYKFLSGHADDAMKTAKQFSSDRSAKHLLGIIGSDTFDGLTEIVKLIDDLRTDQELDLVWAWTMSKLYNKDGQSATAIKAIEVFVRRIVRGSRTRLSDLLQVLTLIRSGIFDQCQTDLRRTLAPIPLSDFVGIANHIIPHLDRGNIYFDELITRLLAEYPAVVAFPFIFSRESDIQRNSDGTLRNPAITEILAKCRHANTIIAQASTLVTELDRVGLPFSNFCLLAVTRLLISVSRLGHSECTGTERENLIRHIRRDFVPELERRLGLADFAGRDREFVFALEDRFRQACASRGEEALGSIFHRQLTTVMETIKKQFETADTTGRDPNFHVLWTSLRILDRRLTDAQSATTPILDMADCSPILAKWRAETRFPVFGQFDADGENGVTIEGFGAEVEQLKSLAKPSTIVVKGSNGHDYKFLLKPHDDLRTEERAMQLFKMMNGFVKHRFITFPVIPLTSMIGLVGWLADTNTIGGLIERYRAFVNPQPADSYDDIIFKQRTAKFGSTLPEVFHANPDRVYEVFMGVLKDTEAAESDLSSMLWYHAEDSQTWLKYQRNFVRSNAISSMAGYLMGIGDRHVHNIMMQRKSGNVVHIDFGLPFERAKKEGAWPEKVPFRLTRMFVHAFGPSDAEGVFKLVCEQTLTAVRQHREIMELGLTLFLDMPVRTRPPAHGSLRTPSEQEESNDKSKIAITLVREKIDGRETIDESQGGTVRSVVDQVDKLIASARSARNLCMMYPGWRPFW